MYASPNEFQSIDSHDVLMQILVSVYCSNIIQAKSKVVFLKCCGVSGYPCFTMINTIPCS